MGSTTTELRAAHLKDKLKPVLPAAAAFVVFSHCVSISALRLFASATVSMFVSKSPTPVETDRSQVKLQVYELP